MIAEDNACEGAADQYPPGGSGAALLFPRESLPSIDPVDTGQAGRPKCRGSRIASTTQPRQFRLDSTRNRLAQHTAEVERPVSVRHHFGRDSLDEISLGKPRFVILGPHHP